jgi:large subunit ribosomal protein L21
MKYAIVESGGKQYKAVEGGTIEVDRMPVETGTQVKLEQVLLLADGETFTVGTPVIKDTPVWTRVVEHFRGEKVTIFNYRPKKRIRVKTGHRQNYTRLMVEQIGGGVLVKKEPVKQVEAEEEKPEAEPKAEKKPAASSPKGKVEAETRKPAPAKKTTKAAPKKESKTASPKGKPAPAKKAAKAEPKKAAPVKKTPAKKSPAKKTAGK